MMLFYLRLFLLQLIKRTDNELFSLNANSPCVTPLHYAAFHGHTDAMSLLINTVIDVDLRDPNGKSTNHFSVSNLS